MKKSKILLTGLTAAVFAASAGAMVACGDDVTLPVDQNKTYTITFNAGEGGQLNGSSTLTVVNGKVTGTIPSATKTNCKFDGWSVSAGGSVAFTPENSGSYAFTSTTTVFYAVFSPNGTGNNGGGEQDSDTEFTITFENGEHGKVSATSAKTVKGIAEFPKVTPDKGWLHENEWVAVDGDDEYSVTPSYKFTEDTTVKPVYVEDPVVTAVAVMYIGDKAYAMGDNSNSISAEAKANGQDKEYLITNLDLEEGMELSFQVRNKDGELEEVNFYISAESRGADVSGYQEQLPTVKTTNTATFKTIALKHNTKDIDGSDKLSWAVYIDDGTEAPTLEDGLYIVGEMTNWVLNSNYYLKNNQLEIDLPADKQFKLGTCSEGKLTWGDMIEDAGKLQYYWPQLDADSQGKDYIKSVGTDKNVALTQAGTYVITVIGNKWSIVQKGEPTPTPTPTPDPDPDPNPNPNPDGKSNGIYQGETLLYALSLNKGQTKREEYWLSGKKLRLDKGDKVSIYMDGQLVSAFVEPSSAGVEVPAEETALTEVTVTVGGDFEIYLHKNYKEDDPTAFKDWSVQFAGPTEVNQSSKIPEGCAKVEFTFTGGSKITIYLVDVDGNAVGEADLKDFALYTFNGEVFGDWNQSVTNGQLQSSMTVTGTVPEGWIFRWGDFSNNCKTGDLKNVFKAGGTYVVQLKKAGTPCVITEIVTD